MRDDGRKRAVAFFTSMFSCYSGCRQYRENVIDAQKLVGDGAPLVEKVRKGFNHPLFIAAQADLVRNALESIDAKRRAETKLLFTAHSIPMSMADNSRYVLQLTEACRLVATAIGQDVGTREGVVDRLLIQLADRPFASEHATGSVINAIATRLSAG